MHFINIVHVTLAHKHHLAIVDNIKSQCFGLLPINDFSLCIFWGISIPLWNTIHLSIPSVPILLITLIIIIYSRTLYRANSFGIKVSKLGR